MYAKLVYKADAANTTTKIMDDVIAVLTGETVIGNLGGVLDTGASSIDTSWEAVAYTLYDTVSSTNKVLQIPMYDNALEYFYWELTVSGSELDSQLWKSWNAATNVGTDGSYYTSSSLEVFSTSNGSTSYQTVIEITASSRHCLFKCNYNASSEMDLRGWMMPDRLEPWDTVANDQKTVIHSYGSNILAGVNYGLPCRRSNNNVYSGTSAAFYACTRYGSNQLDALTSTLGSNSSAARALDSSLSLVHNMYEFGFQYASTTEGRFKTGNMPNMYIATYQNGALGDTVTINFNTYRIWPTDANYRLAIRHG
jgi:hypothetical protein